MLSFFYNLLLPFAILGMKLGSFFNKKLTKRVKGNNYWKSIPIKRNGYDIWFHCASLGEFEQGRPMIEGLKAVYPDKSLLLTFFSPSGFEVQRDYNLADFVTYLPFDTKSNAKGFLRQVKPHLAVFVKYELWPNFLCEIRKNKIDCLLISALFRKDQWLFKYPVIGREILSTFKRIFTQNEDSVKLLENIGIRNGEKAGDTRVDRVIGLLKDSSSFSVGEFYKDSKVIVFGSTWNKDESIIIKFINEGLSGWKYIIAPHEIDERSINDMISKIHLPTLKYSSIVKNQVIMEDVLILDTIGILKHIYAHSNIAYIGGGFGKGIHNILEPAVFGSPVIFGPNYNKFEEAKVLLRLGGAFTVRNYYEFKEVFRSLTSDIVYSKAQTACRQYFVDNKGASNKILRYIEENSLLIQ